MREYDSNTDPRFAYAYAVFFYPKEVDWQKANRNPRQLMPRYKIIVNGQTKEAFWIADYALDLFNRGKIQWITAEGDNENSMKEWCLGKGIRLIERPAIAGDLLSISL